LQKAFEWDFNPASALEAIWFRVYLAFPKSTFKLENYISKMYIVSSNGLNVMDDLGEDYMVTIFA
jgi:hypothetical protein